MSVEHRNIPHPETESGQTKVMSLREPRARQEAAHLAKNGEPIGTYNRGVCAIWGDGGNLTFPNTVASIKGEERGSRPLAASLPTEQFLEYLDTSNIPPSLRDTFTDARTLASRTGSLCFFRAPITEEATSEMPPSMVSIVDGVPIIQNWDAQGHRPTHKLLRAMRHEGIRFPAVTSMNLSGQPEITNQDEAIEFSTDKGIPIFLEDRKDPRRAVGSYTILGISDQGLRLIREGNIPSNLLQEMLGAEIDTSDATVAKSMHPLDFSADRIRGVNPRMARIAILSSLQDRHPAVTNTLLRTGKILG